LKDKEQPKDKCEILKDEILKDKLQLKN